MDELTPEAEVDAVVPAETDAAEPVEAAASSPAPDWSSPELQQHISQQVEQQVYGVLEQLANQQQQPDPGQQQVELDPFDPDYPEQIRQMARAEAEAAFREQFGQFQPAIQHAQQEWAENWVNGSLDQLGVTDPALREEVVYATPGFLQGAGGNPQVALAQAAQWAKSRDEARKAAYIEEYKQSLQPGAPAGAPQGGAGLEIQEQPKSFDEVLAKWTSTTNV